MELSRSNCNKFPVLRTTMDIKDEDWNERFQFYEAVWKTSPIQLVKFVVSKDSTYYEMAQLPAIEGINPTGEYMIGYRPKLGGNYLWSLNTVSFPVRYSTSISRSQISSKLTDEERLEQEEADKILQQICLDTYSPVYLYRLLEVTRQIVPNHFTEDMLGCEKCMKNEPLKAYYKTAEDLLLRTKVVGSNYSVYEQLRACLPRSTDSRLKKDVLPAPPSQFQLYCICNPTISVILISEAASWIMHQILTCVNYRKQFINVFYNRRGRPGCMKSSKDKVMYILMSASQQPYLDIVGNRLVNSYLMVRCELETALSWLSTLGGAFSALGDISEDWATEAGRISTKQLLIAVKMHDPLIASRCRLYGAISMLQRGYLREARIIVKNVYNYALSLPDGQDPKLRRMCLGVWAKLQYTWRKNREQKIGRKRRGY